VTFAEVALQFPEQDLRFKEMAQFYIDQFFVSNRLKNQIYVRALLVKARLITLKAQEQLLKGEQRIAALQKALGFVRVALEIIATPKNKTKYAFLVYNTSLCVYQIIRSYIKRDWIKNFIEFAEKIDRLFDEVDEPDFNWRCRFSWILYQCLYDAERKPDAFKVLDKLWESSKKRPALQFRETLFRLRIHLGKENPNMLSSAKKDAEVSPDDRAWKLLLPLQMMKSGLIPEAQIEKELINVVNQMSSSILLGSNASSSNKLTPIIQERLAEAGRIALSYNLVNIADQITSFLSKNRYLAEKPLIMHEYNLAELLIKKAGPLIDNKTGMRMNAEQVKQQEIERRVEALKILEKIMNSNRKLRDPDLITDGAVLIWNIGLPFLNQSQRQNV